MDYKKPFALQNDVPYPEMETVIRKRILFPE